MTRNNLKAATRKARDRTCAALKIMYEALNQGQRKKILKDEGVKKLFELYKVEYEEDGSGT